MGHERELIIEKAAGEIESLSSLAESPEALEKATASWDMQAWNVLKTVSNAKFGDERLLSTHVARFYVGLFTNEDNSKLLWAPLYKAASGLEDDVLKEVLEFAP